MGIEETKKNVKKQKRVFENFSLILYSIAFVIAGGFLGIVLSWIFTAPSVDTLQIQPQSFTSSIVYEENSKEHVLKELHGDENRVYVDFDKIPLDLRNAFIAIEDERFREHNGIDFFGIMRAIYIDIKTMSASEGASTITQQLVKITALSPEKAIKRKMQEMYLALQVEKKWSKDQILEAYLNTLNLGYNIAGVQQASKYYFDKDVRDLTLAESAVIAGITQNPSLYTPFRSDNTPSRSKQKVILKKMLDLNMITSEEYEQAMSEPVYERLSKKKEILAQRDNTNSYFVDQIIEDVSEALQERLGYSSTLATNTIYRGGIKIYATIDKNIQDKLDQVLLKPELFPPTWSADRSRGIQHTEYGVLYEFKKSVQNGDGTTEDNYYRQTKYIRTPDEETIKQTFEEALQEEKDKYKDNTNITITGQILSITPQPQVAVAIVDPYTGYVKGLSGGIGDKKGDLTFNRATSKNRQIGSTIKPLAVYGPAMELLNYSPWTTLTDAPYEIRGHQIQNYDRSYRGRVSLQQAITMSLNVPAVMTLENVGMQQSIEYLHKMGFTQLDSKDKNPVLALGGTYHGISPLQLASAYGTFANKGVFKEPTTFYKVVDREGNIILEINPKSTQVFSPETSGTMTSILEEVIRSGTGTAARFRRVNVDEAGKTGTTSDYKDKLFVGFTPYYSAAVWMGMDDNQEMNKSVAQYPPMIWRAIMEEIHEDLEPKRFDIPRARYYAPRNTEPTENQQQEQGDQTQVPEEQNETSEEETKVEENSSSEDQNQQDQNQENQTDPQQAPAQNPADNSGDNIKVDVEPSEQPNAPSNGEANSPSTQAPNTTNP